jgi:plastocyanin
MLASMALRVLLVATLLLSACASEPETAASPPPTATPTPVATASPSPAPSPAPSPPAERACTDATVTGEVMVRIRVQDFLFNPACLIVLGGQGLEVRNRGANLHNFTIEGSQIGFDIRPGEVIRTEAVGGAVPPGTYEFFCFYHRAQGMSGEITVSAAG